MNKKIKSGVFTFDENVVIVNEPDDKKESLSKKKVKNPKIKKVKTINKIYIDQ